MLTAFTITLIIAAGVIVLGLIVAAVVSSFAVFEASAEDLSEPERDVIEKELEFEGAAMLYELAVDNNADESVRQELAANARQAWAEAEVARQVAYPPVNEEEQPQERPADQVQPVRQPLLPIPTAAPALVATHRRKK